jgi:hypothetical protein
MDADAETRDYSFEAPALLKLLDAYADFCLNDAQ